MNATAEPGRCTFGLERQVFAVDRIEQIWSTVLARFGEVERRCWSSATALVGLTPRRSKGGDVNGLSAKVQNYRLPPSCFMFSTNPYFLFPVKCGSEEYLLLLGAILHSSEKKESLTS